MLYFKKEKELYSRLFTAVVSCADALGGDMWAYLKKIKVSSF